MLEDSQFLMQRRKSNSVYQRKRIVNFSSFVTNLEPIKINQIKNPNDSNENNSINENKKSISNFPSPEKNTNRNNIYRLNSMFNHTNEISSPIINNIRSSLKNPPSNKMIDINDNESNYLNLKFRSKENSIQKQKLLLKRLNTLKNKHPNSFFSIRLSDKDNIKNADINTKNERNSMFLHLDSNKTIDFLKKEKNEIPNNSNIKTERINNKFLFNNIKKQKSLIGYINKKNSFSSVIDNSYKKNEILTDNNSNRRSTIFTGRNYNKTFYKSQIDNPLLISEEDKIFNERKKYLCYKYEEKNEKKNKPIKNIKKKLFIEESNVMKLKILRERKKKFLNPDSVRLNYLYMSTNKINKKIDKVKKKKDKKNLTEYQNKLLNIIKPAISDYRYSNLKNKLFDIRHKSEKKYQYNYKKLKEIEEDEKEIINEFNNLCTNCLKTFEEIREEKLMLHFKKLTIKLPLLNFISCIKDKRDQREQKKKRNKKN